MLYSNSQINITTAQKIQVSFKRYRFGYKRKTINLSTELNFFNQRKRHYRSLFILRRAEFFKQDKHKYNRNSLLIYERAIF